MSFPGRRVFPTEVICHILACSSARDVVRWRAVSKWFRAVTYDVSIWRSLYSNSYLPRPSGPFRFQSSAYLEQALVRTEKLAQSWTTVPIRDISHVKLRIRRTGPIILLGGRWILQAESNKRLVLHDVDPLACGENHAPRKQLLWEREEDLVEWGGVLITTEDRQSVLYVLASNLPMDPFHTHMVPPPSSYKRRLLEVRLDSKSGELSAVAVHDIPSPSGEFFNLTLRGGNSPLLYISSLDLVFDTRNRVFYEFPEFHIEVDEIRHIAEVPNPNFIFDCVILTDTHIISSQQSSLPVTLIQAFAVDEFSVRDGKGVLRLTHQGVLYNRHNNLILLRNSIVDPVTGATSVRLLHRVYDSGICDYTHSVVNLMLPEPCGEEVLPMSVVIEEKITQELQKHKEDGKLRADFSDAGYLRALLIQEIEIEDSSDFSFSKIVLDATQDECTLAFGESVVPEWNDIEFTDVSYESGMSFDGGTGRLCFVESRDGDDDSEVVVVVDLE